MTAGLRVALAVWFLAGCAGSPTPEAAAPGPAAELRQAVEDLRREVAELRLDLEASRRAALQRADLAGVRAELRAVQAALQALVRDVEQRQLEGDQALAQRLAGLDARVAELAAAVRRAEAGLAPRLDRPEAAPAPPPAEVPREAPVPALRLARPVTIRRVGVDGAGNPARVTVEADAPLGHRAFTLEDPPRLVVDFDNARYGFARAPAIVSGEVLERVRFIQLRAVPTSVVRLVLTLTRPVPHAIETRPRGLVIQVGDAGPAR